VSDLTGRLSIALADRYRIERELGAGGMATVYLAADLRHDREVAIKVLHPDLAAALGGERFLAEIKTTARLQHPHILPLLDSGAADGLLFYVMPFIAGETLRGRLERERQLPVDDALRIAREVADALSAAHALGIIHRDIKPENILLQGGHALVADFGIALAVSAAGGQRMTQTGLSLGTPQYMSPEQAMGERQIDARADQYALGAVTYEMLTGEAPFTGPSVQAIVARVLSEEPRGIVTQRRAVPPEVEGAVLRALEKLPADRFASVAEFSAALGRRDGTGVRAAAVVVAPARRGAVAWLSAALATVAIIAVWGWLRPAPAPSVIRYLVQADSAPTSRDWGGEFAISPDGKVIALAGGATKPLLIRRASEFTFTPLAGTEGASRPFFSSDGAHVGYLAVGRVAMVPVAGGPPTVIARDTLNLEQSTFGDDGYLYRTYQEETSRWVLARTRVEPGAAVELYTALDTAAGEHSHSFPEPLPDGAGILFHVQYIDGRRRIAFASGPGAPHHIVTDGVRAKYTGGFLVYSTSDGRLWDVPFDVGRGTIEGTPRLIATDIQQSIAGPTAFSLSRSGTLVYERDDPSARRELVWYTRDGTPTPLDPTWLGSFSSPAISPDGARVAVTLREGEVADIWVRSIAQGPAVRRTFGSASHEGSEWSPDGRWFSFVHGASGGTGSGAVWRQPADFSAAATETMVEERPLSEQVWTSTGWLIGRTTTSTRGAGDVVVMRPGVDTVPRPFLAGPTNEYSPSPSPDGSWLAYASNESGRFEIYVTSFPERTSAKWQVSSQGGVTPLWSPRGDEIFFLDLEWNMVAARVATRPALQILGARRLFHAGGWAVTAVSRRHYDVSPDGQRFLAVRLAGGGNRRELHVIENWLTEARAAAAGR
jgi:hypothetical protein